MDLVLRGGRVLGAEPSGPGAAGAWRDVAADVRVRAGRVVEIGPGLRGGREVDVADLWIVPGLVDLRTHLGEPGAEHKEDLASGARAAAHGGYTTICAMPDTAPVNDQRTVTELIVRRAAEIGLAHVRPIGAITRGLGGERLADIADMKDGGIVAVADGDRPVADAAVLRRALEYARTFDLTLVQHAEDAHLAEGGVMHEGALSTRIGLRAHAAMAEAAMVARDLEIVGGTGGRYHVAHVSAARTVELIRDGKRRGLPITAEVSPLHLALTEAACATYDPQARLLPPLRSEADRQALLAGLIDGTLDAIATDHTPCALTEKEGLFEEGAPGAVGLETTLALVLGLVARGELPLARALAALTSAPARVFALGDAGTIAVGGRADLAIVDPARAWTVGPDELVGKSKNSPLTGQALVGRAVLTLFGGVATCDRDRRLA
ncbi:MAG: dihydroorotase [Myxococcales bacterium]|nr:dihydroorotase [Myxococcales bacterium]